jgi:hypothetical protein
MFLVLVDKSLDEIDLFERQLNGVQVLRLTRNVGGPELRTQSKVKQFITHEKTSEEAS